MGFPGVQEMDIPAEESKTAAMTVRKITPYGADTEELKEIFYCPPAYQTGKLSFPAAIDRGRTFNAVTEMVDPIVFQRFSGSLLPDSPDFHKRHVHPGEFHLLAHESSSPASLPTFQPL